MPVTQMVGTGVESFASKPRRLVYRSLPDAVFRPTQTMPGWLQAFADHYRRSTS
jgi:hypothetical protein